MGLMEHVWMQVRNLNYLNRDLSKVLLITASTDAYHLQPDNAIKACCPRVLRSACMTTRDRMENLLTAGAQSAPCMCTGFFGNALCPRTCWRVNAEECLVTRCWCS